jgi:hypothetical protein
MVKFLCPSFSLYPKLIPRRTALSTTHLKRIAYKACEKLHEDLLMAKSLTLSLDTWINICNRNIMGIILHLPSGEPVVYGAPDVTDEGRDRFAAKDKIKTYLEDVAIGDRIHAVATDSASVYRAAKEMLAKEHPNVLFLPCFARQVNLIVLDCAKVMPWLQETVNKCSRLVGFFGSPARAGVLSSFMEPGKSHKLVKMVPTR